MQTTTAKHTPGPWKLDAYLNSGSPNPGIVVAENPHGEGAEQVASIEWIAGGFHAEQVANARLIAAAPDLLKALEAAHCPVWVHNAGHTSDIEALRKIALWFADWSNNTRYAAIRKARGE
jgi:hypothetical protein